MNNSIQIAAFKVPLWPTDRKDELTAIVKRSKSGHYFFNAYYNGKKVHKRYIRVSGGHLTKSLRVSYDQLKQKIINSTRRIEMKVASARIKGVR